MGQFDESAWGVKQQGTSNATAVYAAVTTASGVVTLPAAWGRGGYWLHLTALSNPCRYQLSDNATAVVAVTAGTTAGATATTAGGHLLTGIKEAVKVPERCTYLALIATTGTTDVAIELRSDVHFPA